jgi:hypothetical protein
MNCRTIQKHLKETALMTKLAFAFLSLAMTLLMTACGDSRPASTTGEKPFSPAEKHLTIKDFGPRETKAGQGFNIQPDGVSAFWFNTENATGTTVVVVNETTLTSSVQNDGKLMTAGVPKPLFGKAGELTVYLQDKATGEKSNEMKFVVK